MRHQTSKTRSRRAESGVNRACTSPHCGGSLSVLGSISEKVRNICCASPPPKIVSSIVFRRLSVFFRVCLLLSDITRAPLVVSAQRTTQCSLLNLPQHAQLFVFVFLRSVFSVKSTQSPARRRRQQQSAKMSHAHARIGATVIRRFSPTLFQRGGIPRAGAAAASRTSPRFPCIPSADGSRTPHACVGRPAVVVWCARVVALQSPPLSRSVANANDSIHSQHMLIA